MASKIFTKNCLGALQQHYCCVALVLGKLDNSAAGDELQIGKSRAFITRFVEENTKLSNAGTIMKNFFSDAGCQKSGARLAPLRISMGDQ